MSRQRERESTTTKHVEFHIVHKPFIFYIVREGGGGGGGRPLTVIDFRLAAKIRAHGRDPKNGPDGAVGCKEEGRSAAALAVTSEKCG